MAAEQQHPQPALSKAELRARLVGDALEHEREDIRFWQAANERERGEALYELLARGERIRKSIAFTRQEPDRLILKEGQILIQPRA